MRVSGILKAFAQGVDMNNSPLLIISHPTRMNQCWQHATKIPDSWNTANICLCYSGPTFHHQVIQIGSFDSLTSTHPLEGSSGAT